ncbi:trans-2-enoyl-CoA reductase (NADPH) TSC13 [Sugiyamaella lignohabitans]|uniref:Trans-2-enoyl-CoA reductase (NADPH) TSC13 n=1 Tax=Sugiyamaella lignohabitans TaxID=796027 RepID=A0A167DYD4_9ASCO|nr:trans-2-enoyl-CoA reductase (NADPH) TSC13 [Sugiyamaella lignohabitans]ANB13440.1 trans-2-enoyl-CoA reductase (NADPH) TSC13 [Sugiyamaella lignohabitans]
MVNILFKSRGKRITRLPENLDLSSGTPVKEITRLLSKATGLSQNRLRLSIPPADGKPTAGKDKKKSDIALDPKENIGDYFGTEDTITINVKDLGPQLAWRTVFIIEYFGPLFIHPFFYFAQTLVYGTEFEHTREQALIFGFVILHFLKREFETVFVHKFSLATMPLFNVFKNSGHYWGLSGILLGYFTYAPSSFFSSHASTLSKYLFSRQSLFELSEISYLAISFLWVFAELANYRTHVILSNLRTTGSTERKIPYGFGFNLVSCPNYFFESVGWLAIFLLSQNWSALVFFVVATAQMWVWAVKKHRRYRKEFPDYPKDRKIYVPYLI